MGAAWVVGRNWGGSLHARVWVLVCTHAATIEDGVRMETMGLCTGGGDAHEHAWRVCVIFVGRATGAGGRIDPHQSVAGSHHGKLQYATPGARSRKTARERAVECWELPRCFVLGSPHGAEASGGEGGSGRLGGSGTQEGAARSQHGDCSRGFEGAAHNSANQRCWWGSGKRG